VSWPRDERKLERVRALMEAEGLDALVVRAPDNVLYLTDFWPMKGYDACVFPREGEPVLICLEASAAEAAASAWTGELRTLRGYDERDPRPPLARTLALALAESAPYRRIGLERSLGTQAADRMVGEPTVFWTGWFDGFGPVATDVADAAPLLARARMIKTAQELERMRLANEIAAAAMEHVRDNIRPGMRESDVGAMFEGHVHANGTGYGGGRVELARALTLVWSGPAIRTFTATGNRPVLEDEPTLLEIWVCADGYWCDHTKLLCPGELSPRYRELEAALLSVYGQAIDHCVPGASLAELDRLVRAGIAEIGYPGQPSHPICHGVGARAHEPPYAHQAGGGEVAEGMVLALEPGCYWEGGGGLRLEDNFLVTAAGAEKLSSFPDGVVTA
jgi:Xaa-Pro aminopeptidase